MPQVLDGGTDAFMTFCIVGSGILILLSFGVVCVSSKYALSLPLVLIYLLEIASLGLRSCQRFFVRWKFDQAVVDIWFAAHFTAHWLALSLFTGVYIKVATQTPLLRDKPILKCFPFLLNIVVLAALLVSFQGYVVLTKVIIWMDWIEFWCKIGLTLCLFIIQIVSVKTIERLITKHELQVNRRVKAETIYVFTFFAIQALVESVVKLSMVVYAHDASKATNSFLKVVYMLGALLLLACYVCFVIIL
jgi:hypothetical protein